MVQGSSVREQFNLSGNMTDDEIEHFMVNTYEPFRRKQQRAKVKAEEEYYLKNERAKIKLGLNRDIPEYYIKETEDLEQQLKELKKNNDPKYGVFITVSPKANSLKDFKKLDEKVRNCISKVWVTDYCYCYEQRSADKDNIKGLHAHILLKRGIKPFHTEREVRSTFNSLVELPKKHIDIQYKRKDWFKDKIAYMRGDKTGEGKSEKVLVDTHMRQLLEIQDLYSSENFFLKYDTNGEN